MENNKFITLNENELLRIERIVLDRDKDDALIFIRDVIKKAIDKESASQMKREKI